MSAGACISGARRRAAFAGLAATVLVACSERSEPPRWIALARGFQPQPLLPLAQRWQSEAGLDPAGCTAESSFVRVRQPLPPASWERAPAPDTWTAALPGGAFAHGAPGFLQLRSESQPLTRVLGSGELPANSFRYARGRFELRLAAGAEPLADLYVTQRMESGRLPADGVWQVRVGEEFGAGIAVWSGHAEEVTCALPARSRLYFEARYITRGEGPVTLRVRVDGETVHESREDAAVLAGEGRWHAVALPPAARAEARISLEAEGPGGQALFLHPVIGPAEVGSYGARPWKDARADVVLFLADTFRADNLAPGNGSGALAPALERFAARALRFTNARSNAAWTLPSIGTLLTGLAPGQHTANDASRALPDELPTIAEALARSGYRTCAVTDAAFFAPIFGLEQGFETFAIHDPPTWDLDWTVARALEFLDQDDGRPLFLLVHTYRTHMPYRRGPDEDLQPWKELVASGCSLLKLKGTIPREEWVQRLLECRERLVELYRDGVRDLDRGFGELLAGLERRGIGERAFVLFTSDHGEALGENEDVFHDGKLWESKLRVPLLVRGPGLAPRDVEDVVSLLDLAPTLAAIAGCERDPRWPGADVLAPLRHAGAGPARPAFAFLDKKYPEIAILDGGKKLFVADAEALASGGFAAAYDLARDPREEHPVTDETWPAELAKRHAALVRALREPAGAAIQAQLSGAQQRELAELGYGGEGD